MVSWKTEDYDFIAIDCIRVYIWPNLIISPFRADRDDPQEENGEVNMFSHGEKKSGGELRKRSMDQQIISYFPLTSIPRNYCLGEHKIDLFLS